MAEQFIINGKNKLEGEVLISGSKNSVAPVLAATLLAEEPCIIKNLPLIRDVFNMINLLESLGAKIEWLDKKEVKVTASDVSPENINLDLIGRTRMSVLLIGPLLSRFKKFKFTPPGGDRIIGGAREKGGGKIGLRPITTHLEGLKGLGARTKREGNIYYFDGEELTPEEIILQEFSVTATENVMMVAASMLGETTIKGAACEPHVQDLGRVLKKMGAKVKGIATHTLKIEGRQELKGFEHSVIPDYLEAGTFMIAGAITPGRLEITNFPFDDLDIFLAKLKQAGVQFNRKENSVIVDYSSHLQSARIQALPHPGFATDLLPIAIPLLTQAEGRSLIHDPLYENRLNFLHELRKMGADIEIVDAHRAFVFGKTPLHGIRISSWDIRAGASLLLAALAAEGRTVIENAHQIDRGYEKIDEKLRKVGADIKRMNS